MTPERRRELLGQTATGREILNSGHQGAAAGAFEGAVLMALSDDTEAPTGGLSAARRRQLLSGTIIGREILRSEGPLAPMALSADMPALPDDHPCLRQRGMQAGGEKALVHSLLDKIARMAGEKDPNTGELKEGTLTGKAAELVLRLGEDGDLRKPITKAVLARVDGKTPSSKVFEVLLEELRKLYAKPPASLPTFEEKVGAVLR